ncbi:S41 family peptidase, partial [Candidatus Saccharibacteria bacterium]|nr:S41 family peptidase [Candidatus Saccharibacteria bacterium]
VLIDGSSASASEIVAGALRDNGAATLVGTTTYGKGSVQELLPISSGASLKVTIAKWYTPKGQNIDGNGLDPDIRVELTIEELNAGNDTQRAKAMEILSQR